jgi:hypothetical protein
MKTKFLYSIIITFAILSGCDSFLEVETPRTDLIRRTVFNEDKTATAAVLDIYATMEFNGFSSGGMDGISLLAAFSSDEWVNVNTAQFELQQFSDNELDFRNSYITNSWTILYKYIFKANAVIEGLEQSEVLTPQLKSELLGEALFIRAFSHFYLVNLWGDIPWINTTDYTVNRDISRTASSVVYQNIIADLVYARDLLPIDYSVYQNERVRPIKATASALLSRIYLFTKDWANAENNATTVIDNESLHKLNQNLSHVFLKNSTETIWQLHSITAPKDLTTFRIVNGPVHGKLREDFVNAFDPNDLRYSTWIGNTGSYFFPIKYKSVTPITEYSTIFRLAEQYLIRAEARVMQDKLIGASSAESDINIIRNRAGLPNTFSNTKEDLLLDVYNERRLELFTEWGHRWLDLKRTETADAILGLAKSTWSVNDALYPIPEIQLLNDPSMRNAQNPGY